MFKALLQGKPFRHPLHPALVHFPIGLFILSLILDGLSYFSDSDLHRASFYAMAGGMGFGILAAIAGLVDRSDIRLDHPARGRANLHMTLNLIALGLFGLTSLCAPGKQQARRRFRWDTFCCLPWVWESFSLQDISAEPWSMTME